MEKIKPIVLRSGSEEYTLEFNRESVQYAERQGFQIEDIANGKYISGMADLFYYAFRMHHKGILRAKTDTILFEELHGMSDAMIERLGDLYAVPYLSLVPDEDESKNSKWSVEM